MIPTINIRKDRLKFKYKKKTEIEYLL